MAQELRAGTVLAKVRVWFLAHVINGLTTVSSSRSRKV